MNTHLTPAPLVLSFLITLPVAGFASVLEEVEPNDSIEFANPIACGNVATASIDPDGDEDFFVLTLAAPSDLHIYTTTDGDTAIDLFASDGATILATDDDSGDGLGSHIGRVGQAAGTYYVRVRSFDPNATFGYTLTVQCLDFPLEAEPNGSIDTASPIRCASGGVSGNLSTPDDLDYFAFSLGTETDVSALLLTMPENSDQQVVLFDALGAPIVGTTVSGASNVLGARVNATLQPGDYAWRLGSATGSAHYNFAVTCTTTHNCAAGTVDTASGPAVDVLFVNGQTGVVDLNTGESVGLSLDAAPLGPDPGRYVLWMWQGDPVSPFDVTVEGTTLGCTANPSPLAPAGAPQPFVCLLGLRLPARACGSAMPLDSPAYAPWTLVRHAGFARPARFTFQGLIEDAGAGNPSGFSVTNAVVVRVQ